jgi:hypothetical protein
MNDATLVKTPIPTVLTSLIANINAHLHTAQKVVICPLSLPDANWPEGLKHLTAQAKEALGDLLMHRKIELFSFDHSAIQKLGAGESLIAQLLGFTASNTPAAFSLALSSQLIDKNPSSRQSKPYIAIRPVSLHAGRDHVVLKRSDGGYATPTQIDRLAQSIQHLFIDYGLELHTPYRNADIGANFHARWFVTPVSELGQPFFELVTSDSQQALGRNIDAYMSTGQSARRWRQLETEIQMTWFDHPVNAELRAQGLDELNSIWIDGSMDVPPKKPSWIKALLSTRTAHIELAQFWQIPSKFPTVMTDTLGTFKIVDDWQGRLYGDALNWLQSWETFLLQANLSDGKDLLLLAGENTVLVVHPRQETFISKVIAKIGLSSGTSIIKRPEIIAALGL